MIYFEMLINEYPQSSWAEQARIWSEVLRECKDLRAASAEPQKSTPNGAQQRLNRAKKLLAQGEYDAALEENQKVLAAAGNRPPADEALYDSALIYAHPGNPKRDYVKSITLFKRLIKEYPRSARTEQAKVWVQSLQESENSKRVAATLTQENEKLKHMIEESKKVDMEIEEKKRDKTR